MNNIAVWLGISVIVWLIFAFVVELYKVFKSDE